MQDLLRWKDSRVRYPLLVRGARQVGKTYLVDQFGKSEFDSFISVNFESQPEVTACFETFDPEEILMRLQSILKVKIEPGRSLLFLDEIQACPKAILAMRYFKEKLPQLHVIGAGSLLEFALMKGEFSFPVGRIEFMHLGPLSFREFYQARNKTAKSHEEKLKLVKEYFIVGGMPAAVSTFCETCSLEDVRKIHEILLSTYQADFSKYASTTEVRYIKLLFQRVFPTIAQQFKYSKVDPHVRSRELRSALDHLQWAGLFHAVHASSASGLPLAAQIKERRFKLLFLDIGLVQHALRTDPELLLEEDFFQVNKGAMAEQFVGQELIAYSKPDQEKALFYWERERRGSEAEVDYLYSFGQQILPIEVKAGAQGSLRSLNQFMEEKQTPIGIQISQKPFQFEKKILSVPFYSIGELPELIKSVLS